MPAATADTLTLPRLHQPSSTSRSRRVASVTTAPAGFEGEGFPVRRAFAGVPLSVLDPFVHMDQMGEIDYAPGDPKGTAWHPHRGFETVTYMIDGAMQHQDSHGGGGLITDGATQWMTAGDGILHIETPPPALVVSGGLFHGIQLWVNLSSAQKRIAPAYQGLEASDVVMVTSPDGGALVRVIAGDVDGVRGPGSTHSPIALLHATLSAGAQVEIPWRGDFNALVYVLGGHGAVGGGLVGERAPISTGQLAVLVEGDHLTLDASSQLDGVSDTLEVLVLGGAPIGEPVAARGPFVMNTREELIEAFDDFQAGRMGQVPPGALMPYRAR